MSSKREVAKVLFTRFMTMALEDDLLTASEEREIESIVDLIIDAVKEEIAQEAMRRGDR